MLKFFDKEYRYEQLCEHAANFSQYAGCRKFKFSSGRSEGVEAVEIRTGTGFVYTILIDKGLDIAWAEYKGIPLSYISVAGVVAPQYYEPQNDEWLRSFCGGLLTTCGLTQVGNPCEFEGSSHGLHGRISNISADEVSLSEEYIGGEYRITVKGKVNQAKSCAENMVLKRKITSYVGKNTIEIEDTIENRGYQRCPFMILYHCNIGFPLLNKNTDIIIPNRGITSMYGEHVTEAAFFDKMEDPQDSYNERVFYLDTISDTNGFATVCVINDKLSPELALIIRYDRRILDNMAIWKQLSKGDYVIGLEPCNNSIKGICHEYESGSLKYLESHESVNIKLQFEIIEGQSRIDEYLNKTVYVQ